jgi:hypothetical protein
MEQVAVRGELSLNSIDVCLAKAPNVQINALEQSRFASRAKDDGRGLKFVTGEWVERSRENGRVFS